VPENPNYLNFCPFHLPIASGRGPLLQQRKHCQRHALAAEAAAASLPAAPGFVYIQRQAVLAKRVPSTVLRIWCTKPARESLKHYAQPDISSIVICQYCTERIVLNSPWQACSLS